MIFGVPLEIRAHENRVGATPFLVEELVKRGHEVYVETGAGEKSHFSDEDYEQAGAAIAPSPEKLYGKANIILKIGEPMPVEYELIRPDHIILAYFYFLSNPEMARSLLARGCSCYAYELLKNSSNRRPLLSIERKIVGELAVHEGAHYLQTQNGGRGKHIGGLPGVTPAWVTVIGDSLAGISAAAHAATLGATVFLIDMDYQSLESVVDRLPSKVNLRFYHEQNLKKILPTTDLLILANRKVEDTSYLHIGPGPLALLPKGAVVVDLNIDYGGVQENGNPTTHDNPVFVKDGIIYYSVPNLAGIVPATASEALSSALMPYLVRFAEMGFFETLKQDEQCSTGLAIYEGRVAHPVLAERLSVPLYDFRANGE